MSEQECELVQEKMASFMNAYIADVPDIEGVPQPVIDKLVANLTLTGSIAELDSLIAELKKMQALGLNEIALRIYDDPADAIRLIGEQFAPALKVA